ncbi:MAG TPA: SPFH domain-containing protein, partial [Bryobacteraceae bacterium]
MLVLRYLLMFIGIGLLAGAAGILVWDLYQIWKSRQARVAGTEGQLPPPELRTAAIRWDPAKRLAMFSLVPLLAGLSIAVVPSGSAGLRVNQFVGTRPKTLYPGVHLVLPLIESLETYNVRDEMFTTTLIEKSGDAKAQTLQVQTHEGLSAGMAVAVRYRLDPSKLAYIHANLPQPLEDELIAPAIASIFRDLAPHYTV